MLKFTSPGSRHCDMWRWNVPPAPLFMGFEDDEQNSMLMCIQYIFFGIYLKLKCLRMWVVFFKIKVIDGYVRGFLLASTLWKRFAYIIKFYPQLYETGNILISILQKRKKKKAQEMETLRKLSTVTECEFKVWCLVLNHVFK